MTDTRVGIVLCTAFLLGLLVWANVATFPLSSPWLLIPVVIGDLLFGFFLIAGSYIQWMLDKNRDEDCGCGD